MNCTKCHKLILLLNTTYGINPSAMCVCEVPQTSPTPYTTGNTLREKLTSLELYTKDGMAIDWIHPEHLNAILEVVIQALPKIVNDLDTIAEKNKHLPSRLQQSTLAESSGYIKAITEVTSLLEQAKSK